MTGRALAARMDFVPEGRFENSPAIYRWGCGEAKNRSPVGTIEIPGWQSKSAVPTGLLAARILRKPSDESLGYYRLSLRDSTDGPQAVSPLPKCRNSRGRLQRPFPQGFSPGLPRPGTNGERNHHRPGRFNGLFLYPPGVDAGRLLGTF